MTSQRTNRKLVKAYTLVELLVVVGIMALAAAIVVPQMIKPGSLQIQAAGRVIMSDIMIAQNEAIAQKATRRAVFDTSNNQYRLTDGNGTTLSATWKSADAQNYVIDFENDNRFAGVTIENANFGGSTILEFDDLGSPINGGTVDVVFENIRYRITVSSFTGRVRIDPV